MEDVARQRGRLAGSPDGLVPRPLEQQIAGPAEHASLSPAPTVHRRRVVVLWGGLACA